MLAKTLGVRPDPVGLVEHDELPREARCPPPQIFVVEDRVAVFLGVRDPDDGVDAGEELVDPCAILGCRRVDIRQIQDGDVGERAVAVVAHLADVEPPEEGSGLLSRALGDPRDGCPGRRTARARRADVGARESVQQARLADAGPADQGEHVRGSLEPESLPGVVLDPPRARRVQTERRRGVDRIVES
jgi:hypothetical protein